MESPPIFNEGYESDDDDDEVVEKGHEKSEKEEQPKKLDLSSLFERARIEDSKKEEAPKPEQREPEPAAITPEQVQEPAEELEQLEPEEQVHVVEQLVQDRTQAIQTELAGVQSDSQAEAEALADAMFIENLADKVESADGVTDELIEEVFAQTLTELEFRPAGSGDLPPMPEAGLPLTDEADTILPPQPPSGTPPTGPGGLDGAPTWAAGAVAPAAANLAPNQNVEEHEPSHSHAPFVIAGGLVGYLLGRRRGRIKTENELLPIQHKLEKKVSELAGNITEKEKKIRELASQKQLTDRLDTRKIVESLNRKHHERSDRKKQPGEQIGGIQTGMERPRSTERSVEAMGLNDLLEVAKGIEYERTNLRTMFEVGRLDIYGLRRIIMEYMRSGDYQGEIRRSLKPEQLQRTPEHLSTYENNPTVPNPVPNVSQNIAQPMNKFENIANQQYGFMPNSPGVGQYNNFQTPGNKDVFRKVLVGAVATVTVVALAVVVGMLLLAL
jgi:hypothetical protein